MCGCSSSFDGYNATGMSSVRPWDRVTADKELVTDYKEDEKGVKLPPKQTDVERPILNRKVLLIGGGVLVVAIASIIFFKRIKKK